MSIAKAGYTYEGGELSLFGGAHNWKGYYAKILRPYFGTRVAEVGAGNGATTEVLSTGHVGIWYAIEPDGSLLEELIARQRNGRVSQTVIPINGTIHDLAGREPVDTIIYIDVLEHIEDDRGELRCAAAHLSVGGYLVVLCPAYQSLYTAFDAAIGHYRRYTLRALKQVAGTELQYVAGFYLDSIGVLTSLVNRLFLKQSMPTKNQIRFWDMYLVPSSRIFDRCIGYMAGRSVVSIWRRV